MLRNDLITLLAQHDNDTVTVNVNGRLIDVQTVTTENGSIVIILDADGSPEEPPTPGAVS
jgi:hypothetical protein